MPGLDAREKVIGGRDVPLLLGHIDGLIVLIVGTGVCRIWS